LVDFNLILAENNGEPAITLACLLLFGNPDVLTRRAAGTCLQITVTEPENPSGGPYTYACKQNVIDSLRDLWTHQGTLWACLGSSYPERGLHELLVNALIHRDYRSSGAINVRLRVGHTLEIQNPGGFLRNLGPHNLINANPVHRNRLLAEASSLLGFCEKSGSGIDIVYQEALSNGYDFPQFVGDADSFSANLFLDGKSNFANFVRRRARDFRLLETLLIVRYLYNCGTVGIERLAEIVQRPTEYTLTLMRDLQKRLIVVPEGPSGYALSVSVLDDIDHPIDPDQGSLFG
jgi:hypothetical protein